MAAASQHHRKYVTPVCVVFSQITSSALLRCDVKWDLSLGCWGTVDGQLNFVYKIDTKIE